MLGLGGLELFFLLMILLCLFSPKEIPELARTILKSIHEIKNIFSNFESKMNSVQDVSSGKKIGSPGGLTKIKEETKANVKK